MSMETIRITERVVTQLSIREMRLLSLVVAIRRDFGSAKGFKGDLAAAVKEALRKLVLNNEVVDMDGVFSLCARQLPREPLTTPSKRQVLTPSLGAGPASARR